jgi:hypothetical protein
MQFIYVSYLIANLIIKCLQLVNDGVASNAFAVVCFESERLMVKALQVVLLHLVSPNGVVFVASLFPLRIPGMHPLQQHFYGGEWIFFERRENLFGMFSESEGICVGSPIQATNP